MDAKEKMIIDSITFEKMLDYAQGLIRSKSINPPADYSEIYRLGEATVDVLHLFSLCILLSKEVFPYSVNEFDCGLGP